MTIRVENVVDYANRKAIEAIRHLPPSGHRLRVFADAWKRANIEYLEFYKREGVGPEDADVQWEEGTTPELPKGGKSKGKKGGKT